MLRNFGLKAILLVVMVALCVRVPIVNAEVEPLNWTSQTTEHLRSVYMVTDTNGWAVGYNGTIIRWDGTSWSTVTSPTTIGGFTDVFMVSADDGWAVGPSRAIHWDGTDWSNVTNPATMGLYSVFMVSADEGWAVGESGRIMRWDGADWSAVTSPTTWDLYSLHMVGADDGWAVGDNGTIIRWTGTEWIPEFPTAILTPLLISLTLVAVILAKTASKKRRKPSLPSKTLL